MRLILEFGERYKFSVDLREILNISIGDHEMPCGCAITWVWVFSLIVRSKECSRPDQELISFEMD